MKNLFYHPISKEISNSGYLILYTLIAIVYLVGLSIPLMENDSAQHAVMAMRMYLNHDYIHLLKGNEDYLDKPHMHFWLSAFSFKLLGLSPVSYRIPALLFTIAGAFAAHHLTADLYSKKYAHYGALIFLTSQTIILANHDVRTDTEMTGAVILSIWMLHRWLTTNKIWAIIVGAFFMGIAFSCKGLLGIIVIGLCLLSYLIYTNNWQKLLNPRLLLGVLVFALTISPVLYSYYQQFDLHPEKIINGKDHISGIKFILFKQSFERYNGERLGNQISDPSFYLHTILWVFLPWSLLFYVGIVSRIKQLFKTKFCNKSIDLLTLGGIILTVTIISLSDSKLPHYLNSLIPVMAVFTAGFIIQLTKEQKTRNLKKLLTVQYIIVGILTLIVFILLFGTFRFQNTWIIIVLITLLVLLLITVFSASTINAKIITMSVLLSCLINWGLNAHFYPNLLEYESGIKIAKLISNNDSINHLPIYNTDFGEKERRWSLDFYLQKNIPYITEKGLAKINSPILIATNYKEELLQETKEHNLETEVLDSIADYRITVLRLDFLNPKTRSSSLKHTYLVKIQPHLIE